MHIRVNAAVQHGHSLIQAMIVTAILAVLCGQGLSASSRWLQANRAESMASKLRDAFAFARTEAHRSRLEYRIGFFNTAASSCMVVYSSTGGARCTCTASGQAACANGAQARLIEILPGSSGISMTANASSVGIEPRSGFVTPTVSIDLKPSLAPASRHIVNITGRLRMCSPDGTAPRLQHC